jgi:hypothetical protein
MGDDLDALPDGIVTGGYQLGPAAFRNPHGAQTAKTSRLEGLVVAEGGDVDVVGLGNLKNGGPFFRLNLITVENKSDHLVDPSQITII